MASSEETLLEGRRVAVVGVSVRPACGVRDHANLLAAELARTGASCTVHWLDREVLSLRASGAEFRSWSRRLAADLRAEQPDVVLLHYSVFSYSYKGVPLFVPNVLSAVHGAGAPLLAVLHELAYRLNFGGLRGRIWGVSQRALLIAVMRASAGVIVTAPGRAEWLSSRRWLPSRPVRMAPVFSNLPAPRVERPGARERPLMGLFGYAYQGAALTLVLDALDALHRRGVPAELALLGAPGRESSAGADWLAQARARGLQGALSFSGRLPAQELSDALAGCDVLLFPDAGGPTSRKGTLAGSLASGRPLVAIDGPHTWRELVAAGAVSIASPTPEGLADALQEQLSDRDRSDALGARGRHFADTEMGIARTAGAVASLLDGLASGAKA